jgi:hypothetical protein
MTGVIIVNEADAVCEFDSELIIGVEYEKKVNSGEQTVVYAFAQNDDKSAWVFKGYATIDPEALVAGLTSDEMEKAVISSKRIDIQALIRGKSGTGGKLVALKTEISAYQALYARFESGDIDAEAFAVAFAELKKA